MWCLVWGQALAISCFTKLSKKDYSDCQTLSATYALHWKIMGDNITFGIEVDGAPGWLGLGVSEAGGMFSADIVTVQRTSNGSWTVTDRWSTTPGLPSADVVQDVALLSAEQDSASTAVQFTRQLSSCRNDDLSIYPALRTYFIWAYGDVWGLQHATNHRGTFVITLQPPSITAVQTQDGTTVFTVSMNVTVPTSLTTYMCKDFQVPSDKKYHIMQSEVIPGSALLHHMVVYGCDVVPPNPGGAPYDCYGQGVDKPCNVFYAGWAPGIGVQNAPAEAAYPIGLGTYKWFTMELHYSNVNGISEVVDNTTLNLHYSPNLRPHDMGSLVLGSQDLNIPPGQQLVNISNLCPATCLSRFASKNITLFSSFYHMHMLGRKMVTQHIRGTNEIQPLGQRSSYSFDFQSPIDVPPGSQQLKSGDAFLTTCGYDSRSRTSMTYFGRSTYDEMCFNFLSYYPKVELDYCLTFGTTGYAVCSNGSTLLAIQKDNSLAISYIMAGYLVPSQALTFKAYSANCSTSAAMPPSPPGSNVPTPPIQDPPASASTPPIPSTPPVLSEYPAPSSSPSLPPPFMPLNRSTPPPPQNGASRPLQAGCTVVAWLFLTAMLI